ncbi:MAG: hypothetical protein ACRCUE_10755, partial [Bosea sp. (in: a-proteobacteria)]
NPPTGCAFHPRCAHATDICKTRAPALAVMPDGSEVACHHTATIPLRALETAAQQPEKLRRRLDMLGSRPQATAL